MTNSSIELDHLEVPKRFSRLYSDLVVRPNQLFKEESFLSFILGKTSGSTVIAENSYVQSRLQIFYQEATSQQKKIGHNPLEIGFPLIFLDRSKRGIPLFIARIQVQNAYSGSISVELDEYYPVQLNAELFQHFPQLVTQNDKYQTFQSCGFKSLNEVGQFAAELLELPIYEEIEHSVEIMEPDSEGLIQLSAKIGLVGAGFHYAELSNAGDCKKQKPVHQLIPMDPDQTSVFEESFSSIAVQSRRGQGKENLIINLLIDRIYNGCNTLVLSKQLSPLQALQNKILKYELGASTFLFRPRSTDLRLLLEFVRNIPSSKPQKNKGDESFQKISDRLLWKKEKLRQVYKVFKQPLVGDLNWTQLVANYLKCSKLEHKDVLATYLNPLFFVFDREEYEYLIAQIKRANDIKTFRKSAVRTGNVLHDHLFLNLGNTESKAWLDQKLQLFIDKTEKLRQAYAVKQIEYSEKLYNYFDRHRSELLKRINNLKDLLMEAEISYGSQLNLNAFQVGLRQVFSSKYRELAAAKNAVRESYLAFVTYFQNVELFRYHFPKFEDIRDVRKLDQIIQNFEAAFGLWRNDLTGRIHEELGRLSTKTAIEEISYSKVLANLENDLNHLLQEINASNVFKSLFNNKSLLIAQQQKLLEDISNQLRDLKEKMVHFDEVYTWNRFWLNLEDNGQRVIGALSTANPNNWMAAFGGWYWYNALIKFDQPNLRPEGVDFKEFATIQNTFTTKFHHQILKLTQTKRIEQAQTLKKSNRNAYQELFQKAIPKALDAELKLARTYWPAIINEIPVLLSTPDAISNIINHTKHFQGFDQVVIDGAQHFSEEQLQTISSWSKRVIFFYNDQNLSNQWRSSLLNMVDTRLSLNFHYDSINFNLPVLAERWPIENFRIHSDAVNFYQLEGRYNEEEEVNEEEAQFVLRQLNDIPENSRRMYPKVGIICGTKAQRNLIAQYIFQIKNQNLPGREKIERLLHNGLEILSISELTSHENFEFIILNLTFGLINLQGEFTKDVAFLNAEKAVKGLNELMAIPAKQMIVVNSIPNTYLSDNIQEPNRNGIFSFATYLLYLRACAEDNHLQQVEAIQKWRMGHTFKVEVPATTTAFLEEVIEEIFEPLQDQFNLLRDYRFQQVRFPFAIQLKDHPDRVGVFIVDGFIADGPSTNFQWEQNFRQEMQAHQVFEMAIWSFDWWKDPQRSRNEIFEQAQSLLTKQAIRSTI